MSSIKKNTVIGIALALLFSCAQKKSEVQSEEAILDTNIVKVDPVQMKGLAVLLGRAEKKNLSGAIKVNGMLDVPPQNMVSVSAPMGGTVKSTELLQGMKVSKGQVLAVLQHQDYIQLQQDFLEAKSKMEFMETEYKRQQELARDHVNSQKTLQQVKTDYETTTAKFSGLRSRVMMIGIDADKLTSDKIQSTIYITSSINGYVTHVNVNIGKFVTPNDVMFTIVDTEHLHAELTVFEKDILKIKIGQKVRFILANEGHERLATVHLIGREISAERTVRIHCHLDKEDTELLPGMFLKAFVEAGAEKVLALPEDALVNYEGRDYVFVPAEKEGTFRMLEIQKGVSELGFTEINLPKGTDEKSDFVVKGAYDLLSALKNKED